MRGRVAGLIVIFLFGILAGHLSEAGDRGKKKPSLRSRPAAGVRSIPSKGKVPGCLESVNRLWLDKSTDAGQTFGVDKLVAQIVPLPCQLPNKTTYRVPNNPTLAVDTSRGPYRGNVYIAWADYGHGDADILFRRSTDGGTSWDPIVRVNDDAVGNGNDQFFPWMSVNESGVITIVFYDTRLDPQNKLVDVFMAVSRDGGVSFEPNVRVTTVSNNFSTQDFIGDYIGVASAGSLAYPLWTDVRRGNEDMFTARVNLKKGSVARNKRVNQDKGPTAPKQNEGTIAINPVNTSNLVAGANDYRAGHDCGFYSSADKGKHWVDGLLPKPDNFDANDPSVAFDALGNAYYSCLNVNSDSATKAVVFKSSDGGKTWPSVAVATQGSGPADFIDKPALAVDRTDSQFQGNIYVVWRFGSKYAPGEVRLARSTDGGQTFLPLPAVSDADRASEFNLGQVPALGPAGEVYVAWVSLAPSSYQFTKVAETGPLFTGLYGGSINSSGQIAVSANRVDGGRDIYRWDGAGLVPIAESGPGFTPAPPPSINDSGAVAFRAILSGGVQGVFRGDGSSIVTIFQDTVNPLELLSLSGEAIDSSGAVVFFHRTCPGGPPYCYTNDKILRGDGTSTVVIADSSDFPNVDCGLGSPATNRGAAIAFAGILCNPIWSYSEYLFLGDQVSEIWTGGSGTFDMLAAINDLGQVAFAGIAGSHTLFVADGHTTWSLSLSQDPLVGGINRAGMVALTMSETVFVADASGTITRVLGAGDVLEGGTVSSVRAFPSGAINDSGQLSLQVTFADGRRAIYRADPTP